MHDQKADPRGCYERARVIRTSAGRQPERSGGNPEKRQRRDAGQPERSGGNPEKCQRRDAGQPERSGGNPEKRQRCDAGQPDNPVRSPR